MSRLYDSVHCKKLWCGQVITESVWNNRGRQSKTAVAVPDPLDDTPAINEAARKALSKAAVACRRVGWFSFWTQLSLSIVSAGILLFSVAFTSQVGCMQARQHLTVGRCWVSKCGGVRNCRLTIT